jgi:hypothetical protein
MVGVEFIGVPFVCGGDPNELGEGMAPRGVFLKYWEVGGLLYVETRELRAVLNACSGLVSDQRVESSTLRDVVN